MSKNKPIKKKKPGEKLNNITPEYDSVREQNVLLEDMHRDIKAIAEGHGIIKQGLDEVKSDLTIVKSELDTVKVATMENSHRIKALEVGQQELKSDVGQLKSDVGQLKSDVGHLKSDVQQLKVGQQKLEQGQERIEQKLDAVTTNHEHRITKIEERALT